MNFSQSRWTIAATASAIAFGVLAQAQEANDSKEIERDEAYALLFFIVAVLMIAICLSLLVYRILPKQTDAYGLRKSKSTVPQWMSQSIIEDLYQKRRDSRRGSKGSRTDLEKQRPDEFERFEEQYEDDSDDESFIAITEDLAVGNVTILDSDTEA